MSSQFLKTDIEPSRLGHIALTGVFCAVAIVFGAKWFVAYDHSHAVATQKAIEEELVRESLRMVENQETYSEKRDQLIGEFNDVLE